MNRETNWYDYDDGYSVGTSGADGGLILRDEEHARGARLTLEEDGSSAPFSVTCTVYGALSHTRFFPAEDEANEEFERMKVDLDEILHAVAADDDADDERLDRISDEMSDFFERFP